LFSPFFTSSSRSWFYGAALLLGILATVLCSRLSHPWTYNDDYNGAFWAQAARNLSSGGFLSTAGVPAPLYFGAPPIPSDALYVHHPTLLPAMMFLDRAILGESEAIARLLPILFSLITAALLWALINFTSGPRCAFFALSFYVAAPMELHYGQMVNFEAPELAFLLAALICFHLWRLRPTRIFAAGLLLFAALAMWTDWQGYLLVPILVVQVILSNMPRRRVISLALISIAILSGLAFLLQIHLASPTSWQELLHAFRERSSQGNLAGGKFTAWDWIHTQFTDLTTLFHPISWLLACAGVNLALVRRRALSARASIPLQIAVVFFLIDAIYVCALRNQSYIHDFASFYFLIPLAIFPAFFIDSLINVLNTLRPGIPAVTTTLAACLLVAFLIYSAIQSLADIDTQFCILDDDDSEPPTLIPDLGRLIDHTFPPTAAVITNFDQYYSPLPYYARRVMTNYARTYPDWQKALSDASPQPVAGIIWSADPTAPALLAHLAPSDLHPITVDGIPFTEWLPAASNSEPH
jgi:4-amino-4-deoxy-L-arabinose transferase-like glycosyltransferase